MTPRRAALLASSPSLPALGLLLVGAATNAVLDACEAIARHPLHLTDRGVRLFDWLRDVARF